MAMVLVRLTTNENVLLHEPQVTMRISLLFVMQGGGGGRLGCRVIFGAVAEGRKGEGVDRWQRAFRGGGGEKQTQQRQREQG